jgi:hypothetical protein
MPGESYQHSSMAGECKAIVFRFDMLVPLSEQNLGCHRKFLFLSYLLGTPILVPVNQKQVTVYL